jgi:very-short-patch-repair endonuclease
MFKRASKRKISHVRRLRRDATEVEKRLWWKLKELNAQGFHFRRQSPFKAYILDFAEHEAKLVVELDGGQHGEPAQLRHDAERDAFLASQGYRTLRFRNLDVLENIGGIVERILEELGDFRERPPPDPSFATLGTDRPPHKGGGEP